MNHRQVADAFAHGIGIEAEGHNLYSKRIANGVVLYSYSTPVAFNYEGPGRHYAAFDERKYSVTTSKQVTQVKRICEAACVSIEVLPHQEFREKCTLLRIYLGAGTMIEPLQGKWWLDEGQDSGVWPCEVLDAHVFSVRVRTTHEASMYYGQTITVDPARVYDSGFNRVADAQRGAR